MTGRVISLSARRKSVARADQRVQADANAVKFGRSKAERAADEERAAREQRHLDGHHRDDP